MKIFSKQASHISPEVQSHVDKKVALEVKKLKGLFEAFYAELSRVKGKLSAQEASSKAFENRTDTLLDNTNYIKERLEDLEKFLGVEFVEEEVAEYQKIKKTK